MKTLTEEEVRKEVYSNTHNEIGPQVEAFIQGAIWMLKKCEESFKTSPPKPFIYERDDDKIYRRGYGTDVTSRELL